MTRVYHWNVNWNGTRNARVIVCRLTNPRIDNKKKKRERRWRGTRAYRVLIVRSNDSYKRTDSYKLHRVLLRSISLAFLLLGSVLAFSFLDTFRSSTRSSDRSLDRSLGEQDEETFITRTQPCDTRSTLGRVTRFRVCFLFLRVQTDYARSPSD